MINTNPIHQKSIGGPVDRVMTIEEIEAQYPSEWILIEDPIAGEGMEVLGGMVRWHSPDRDEMYRKAIELRLPRSATHYTGRIPEGTAIIL
ncbi:MAG: hypothetical protein WD669_00665 [Pirellulales bacterium]